MAARAFNMCLMFVGGEHLSEDRSIRKVKKKRTWLTESSPATNSIFEDLTTESCQHCVSSASSGGGFMLTARV